MSYIDELFNELNEKEIVDIEGSMDKDKQQRIEDMVIAGIQNENKNEHIKNEGIKLENNNRKKKFGKKKFVTVILAATFLMAMMVYASEIKEWDIAIVNFMGIHNADTVQLEDGVVEMEATALSSGVTMKAVTSVGDKNSAYIRIDTDYKLPETFNEETDYIIPNGWNTTIYKNKMELQENHGGTLMYFNNDGYLSFMMYISNCEGVNRKNINVTFSDLYIYHDLNSKKDNEVDHGTLLLSGEWVFTWKYNYRSNVNTYYPLKKVVSNGDNCLVTKIEISPITIRVEAIKNPTKRSQKTSVLLIKKITMKDGSVVEFDPENTSGGCKNNTFLQGYRDVLEMGEAIDPSNVYSITIGDTDIIL